MSHFISPELWYTVLIMIALACGIVVAFAIDFAQIPKTDDIINYVKRFKSGSSRTLHTSSTMSTPSTQASVPSVPSVLGKPVNQVKPEAVLK